MGPNKDEIENKLIAIDPVMHKLLSVHYSALNFSSKPEEYWENGRKPDTFYVHIFRWCTILGIRNELPDDFEIKDIKEALMNTFGYMNENSIAHAMQLNFVGKFTPAINAFNRLNAKFIYELLTAYDAYLKPAHKKALEIRDQLKPAPEPTEEEIQNKLCQGIMDLHRQFRETNDFKLISGAEYTTLEMAGYIALSRDEKFALMDQAKDELKAEKVKLYEGLPLSKTLKEINAGDAVVEVALMAKKLAVRNCYLNHEKIEL